MGLGNFVVFDDDDSVEVKPKKKPSKKVETKVEPSPKPKKVIKSDTIKVTNEKPMFASASEQATTKQTLVERFEQRKKIGKDVYNTCYKGKKTLLGSLIKQTDKVMSVLLVNGDNAKDARFISVSPRYITDREIESLSKRYVSLDHSRRELALVEAKYMNGVDYQKHRQKIVDQFL